jgi:hypothetical protein
LRNREGSNPGRLAVGARRRSQRPCGQASHDDDRQQYGGLRRKLTAGKRSDPAQKGFCILSHRQAFEAAHIPFAAPQSWKSRTSFVRLAKDEGNR